MSKEKPIDEMSKGELFAMKTELTYQKKSAELHLSELNDKYRKRGQKMPQKEYNALVDEQSATKERIHQISSAAMDIRQALRKIAENEHENKAERISDKGSLRDHFAGLAMQSLVANGGSLAFAEELVRQAYMYADAMLLAREE